jgi:ABC-type nitrate/sulfonate/bicarbonate transport system substrate-binding protein
MWHSSRCRRISWLGCVAASAALLGLSAAGCSSSGSSASTTAGSSSQTVTVAASGNNIFDLPIWEGQAGGYYAKQGLNVKFSVLSTGTLNSALNSGSVDFLDDNPTTFLEEHATGSSSQVVVEGLSTGVPMGLVISTTFAKAHGITAATPPATVAKDLIGSTGGSSAKSTLGEADMFLRQYGVQPSQVKIATLSTVTADQAALQSNEIDWFCTAEPVPFQMQNGGHGIVVGTPSNVQEWGPSRTGLSEAIVTTANYASGNPATVKKFVTATEQATAYLSSHQAKAVALAQSEIPGLTSDVLQKTDSLITWLSSGQMDSSQWQSTVAFSETEGTIASGTNLKQNVDWTNKYL